MKTICHDLKTYPSFQEEGNASQFAIPFAKHFCIGKGYDIGYGKEDWKFPGAIGIENLQTTNATKLSDELVDYIYSSHCLEHIPNWVNVLELWVSRIKDGGILFLYLPDFSQTYWRPWNNRKHLHIFTPEILTAFLEANKSICNYFVSQVDLNNSFMVVAEIRR